MIGLCAAELLGVQKYVFFYCGEYAITSCHVIFRYPSSMVYYWGHCLPLGTACCITNIMTLLFAQGYKYRRKFGQELIQYVNICCHSIGSSLP